MKTLFKQSLIFISMFFISSCSDKRTGSTEVDNHVASVQAHGVVARGWAVAGAKVLLRGARGEVLDSTVTDSSGAYSFQSLVPSTDVSLEAFPEPGIVWRGKTDCAMEDTTCVLVINLNPIADWAQRRHEATGASQDSLLQQVLGLPDAWELIAKDTAFIAALAESMNVPSIGDIIIHRLSLLAGGPARMWLDSVAALGSAGSPVFFDSLARVSLAIDFRRFGVSEDVALPWLTSVDSLVGDQAASNAFLDTSLYSEYPEEYGSSWMMWDALQVVYQSNSSYAVDQILSQVIALSGNSGDSALLREIGIDIGMRLAQDQTIETWFLYPDSSILVEMGIVSRPLSDLQRLVLGRVSADDWLWQTEALYQFINHLATDSLLNGASMTDVLCEPGLSATLQWAPQDTLASLTNAMALYGYSMQLLDTSP